MPKIYNQPYPYPQQTLFRRFLQCLFEGVFIAAFLIVFQPFGTSLWQDPNKIVILWGYGIITMVAGLVVRIVLPNIFPSYFNENTWTIAKQIVATLVLLALITTGNVLYSNFAFGMSFRFIAFFWMFLTVLVIGIFPISFGIAANYIYQLKKYTAPVVVRQGDAAHFAEKSVIRLVADNDKDFLSVNAADLLFIESSDNYATVYFLRDHHLQKELIRSSLSRLENQISDPSTVRCHRSYIINLGQVVRVSGNAQGYKFHLKTTDLVVPVARKYSNLIDKLR